MQESATLPQLSGLDLLRKMQRGELPPPPFAEFLDMRFELVEEGRAVFSITPKREFYNPMGQVHGGVISSLLDSAMGCAVHSTLPEGVGYTTIELSINFVRAVPTDAGRVVAEGQVVHVGGRLATGEGRLTLEDGTLLAHGTTTCMVFR